MNVLRKRKQIAVFLVLAAVPLLFSVVFSKSAGQNIEGYNHWKAYGQCVKINNIDYLIRYYGMLHFVRYHRNAEKIKCSWWIQRFVAYRIFKKEKDGTWKPLLKPEKEGRIYYGYAEQTHREKCDQCLKNREKFYGKHKKEIIQIAKTAHQKKEVREEIITYIRNLKDIRGEPMFKVNSRIIFK